MKKVRQANCLSYSVPSNDEYGVVLQAGDESQEVRTAWLFLLKRLIHSVFFLLMCPKPLF